VNESCAISKFIDIDEKLHSGLLFEGVHKRKGKAVLLILLLKADCDE
jgi:hypothetical protein